MSMWLVGGVGVAIGGLAAASVIARSGCRAGVGRRATISVVAVDVRVGDWTNRGRVRAVEVLAERCVLLHTRGHTSLHDPAERLWIRRPGRRRDGESS